MKLEQLYDLYGEKLFHYLSVKLGSLEDAEDVLQEIFTRFSRYNIRWKFIRKPEAFIFRVARNEANRFLQNKKNQKLDPQNLGGLQDIIQKTVEGPDQDSTEMLARALAKLPDEQREVILFKVFEGLTFKEIAAACGLSINTVASRYRYGLAAMKAIMEGKDERNR
ncbi:MAG: RNA polymerase sigma factor [Candidatus Aminicenantes bacterium]|nr:RNA polymerase sigma factor [Candidatus Aminicenantes bacterium]